MLHSAITEIDKAEPIPKRPSPSVRSRRIITTVVCCAPPRTAGTTKKPSQKMKVIITPASTPGTVSGRKTWTKARQRLAPRVRAAGTSCGGTRAIEAMSVSTM